MHPTCTDSRLIPEQAQPMALARQCTPLLNTEFQKTSAPKVKSPANRASDF